MVMRTRSDIIVVQTLLKKVLKKVSAETVRSCPPLPVTDSMVWAVDDVVEVLDGGYWKVSVIVQVLRDDCYQIHVIGSIDEFRVKKSSIRMRQEWKDNNWVLLGKELGNCEDMITRMRRKARMQQQGYSECMQKRRAVNNEAKLDAIHEDMYSFTGNPDSHGNLKSTQGKDNLLISTMSRRNLGNAMFLNKTSKLKDSVSCLSSVASCSVIDPRSDRVLSHASTSCSQEADSLCSDAESFNPLGDEEGKSVGEQQGAFKTHELDLHSYRHILEALYASGPLSWDQEILLTDLRKELYVSNDEHLMELRTLRCAGGVALSCY